MPSDPNKAALGSGTTASESTPVDSVKVQVLLLAMTHAKRCERGPMRGIMDEWDFSGE